MKKLRNISYVVAAFVVTTATSCKKQLEEYNPSASTGETLFSTPAGFRSLVNMSYQDLHEYYGIIDGLYMCESGTDLWYNYGKNASGNTLTQYLGLSSAQPQNSSFWTASYRGVNYCNTGIKFIDKAGLPDLEKPQRLAELRFLRALYYYHIVEQYGNVTLVTAPGTDGVNMSPTRSDVEKFYDLMISDLEYAKDNLPVKWADVEYSRASKKSAMGLLARVLLTRAYYSTGSEAQAWFTKAKDVAVEVINTQAALGVSLYPKYSDIGPSVYGSAANRAANKEAMFLLAYNEANNTLNAWTGKNGNRIFKWMLSRYVNKPGMSSAVVNAYGVADEPALMPTWHHLDLFNESKDARYAANFQEAWMSNTAFTWTTANIKNTGANISYEKFAVPTTATIPLGDTALFFTKKDWGGRTRDIRYLVVDRNDLYESPVSGQGAKIKADPYVNIHFPSFKKWVNANRTSTSNQDFGDAMIIRLAEMYLIAAEASVQLNNQTDAAKYVNVVRRRAAIPGQETAMEVAPSDMTIQFILDERGREFGGEMQRWYDLKRVFHKAEDWVAYIKKWNPDIELVQNHHWVRPIPTNELTAILNTTEYGQNKDYQ
jgi:starch-binding outer membrane protein, SusD/RagB family